MDKNKIKCKRMDFLRKIILNICYPKNCVIVDKDRIKFVLVYFYTHTNSKCNVIKFHNIIKSILRKYGLKENAEKMIDTEDMDLMSYELFYKSIKDSKIILSDSYDIIPQVCRRKIIGKLLSGTNFLGIKNIIRALSGYPLPPGGSTKLLKRAQNILTRMTEYVYNLDSLHSGSVFSVYGDDKNKYMKLATGQIIDLKTGFFESGKFVSNCMVKKEKINFGEETKR